MAIKCCKYCVEERSPGCHDTCEKYKEEKRAWEEKRAKARVKSQAENDVTHFRINSIEKWRKKQRK